MSSSAVSAPKSGPLKLATTLSGEPTSSFRIEPISLSSWLSAIPKVWPAHPLRHNSQTTLHLPSLEN
jgi:hypothetical protein